MKEQIGKGYPDGLKGDEIEEVVKIVTVADSFDAITSKRVYRDERTIEEGLEELKKNIGTQFEEKFVNIMIKCYEENKEEFMNVYNIQRN